MCHTWSHLTALWQKLSEVSQWCVFKNSRTLLIYFENLILFYLVHQSLDSSCNKKNYIYLCVWGEREKEVRERNLYKYKQTSISICIENHISSAQAAQNLGESDPSTNIISDSMTPPPVPHLLFSNRQIISKILPIYLNSHCSCDCM